ncbi:MAG: non-ribosomal peptide synthetase, partial [Acidobacteria bacterium]|nr:non-ribosomal peptide synthetase [Acidobacteriota bacterium]
ATQVVSRVRETFGVEIPLRALFGSPSVRGLAVAVEDARREGSGRAVPPLVPVPRDGALPLSFAQERMWFLHRLEPTSTAYNIDGFYHLHGRLDVAVLSRVIGEILRRHEVLRTTFETVDGRPVPRISPDLDLALPVVDLRALPDSTRRREARRLAGEEAARPFDLALGPLVRLSLLRLGDDEHLVLLTLHHIVSDGWSMSLLGSEVAALYRAFVAGESSPLPELPIQYLDFAAWQRAWLAGEVLDEQMDYWREHLAGAPPLIELPTDRPRTTAPQDRGAQRPVHISAQATEALQALGRRSGATLFMTLLSAFQALLWRYGGQDDILVGSPIAGRNRIETEGLIGFFVNTLVLRGNLSGDPGFELLLANNREVVLEAHAHQDLPFEKLV